MGIHTTILLIVAFLVMVAVSISIWAVTIRITSKRRQLLKMEEELEEKEAQETIERARQVINSNLGIEVGASTFKRQVIPLLSELTSETWSELRNIAAEAAPPECVVLDVDFDVDLIREQYIIRVSYLHSETRAVSDKILVRNFEDLVSKIDRGKGGTSIGAFQPRQVPKIGKPPVEQCVRRIKFPPD